MAQKKKTEYVVAIDNVVTSINGVKTWINRGDLYPKNHPAVKVAKCFVSQEEYASRFGVLVEQATAGPGEVRNVTTPETE